MAKKNLEQEYAALQEKNAAQGVESPLLQALSNKLQKEKGQLAAIGREMIKDLRSTINEVFFDKPEHGSEPGTPYNPTQAMITNEVAPDIYGRGRDKEQTQEAGKDAGQGPARDVAPKKEKQIDMDMG